LGPAQEQAKEIQMKNRILAGAALLVFAAGVTTSAMASDYRAVRHSHVRHIYPGRVTWDNGAYDRGGLVDLGPLGVTTACGAYRNRPASCGYGTPIFAWSR
jgi:hypothetical protein